MRFSFADHLDRTPRPLREIERADAVTAVCAPDAWTDVQIESWLEWAQAQELRSGDDPLEQAADALAARPGARAARAKEAASSALLGVVAPADRPDAA